MIDEEKRWAVFKKCHGCCYYCHKKLAYSNRKRKGRAAWEIEHLLAKAEGGTDHLNNLVAACWQCNLNKSTRPSRSVHREMEWARDARESARYQRQFPAAAGLAVFASALVGIFNRPAMAQGNDAPIVSVGDFFERYGMMVLIGILVFLVALYFFARPKRLAQI